VGWCVPPAGRADLRRVAPLGNTGTTTRKGLEDNSRMSYIHSMADQNLLNPFPQDTNRVRLQVELSPVLVSLLDHITAVTGASRAAVTVQALTEVLPVLVERVDGLKRRAAEVSRSSGGKSK
jgi:hypothetical protein